MWYNQNSGYWQALLTNIYNQVGVFGDILIVMNSSDTDEANYQHLQDLFPPDEGKVRFYTSLESAYAAAEANNNDVILLDGNGTHVIAEAIDWSKSRVHLFGMDGWGRRLQQWAKVQNTDGTAAVYLIKNTSTRSTFHNIKFIQVDDDATSLTVFQEGWEWTVIKNCSFVFGVADNLDQTDAYEFVHGGDSATIENCTFWSDTLWTSGARAVMAISRVNGTQEHKSNFTKDCLFQINSSESGADFIRVLATNSVLFGSTMENMTFNCAICSATSWAALDDAVRSVSSLVWGNIFFVNPASNCTEFCSDVTDQITVIGYGLDGTNPAQKIGIGLTPA